MIGEKAKHDGLLAVAVIALAVCLWLGWWNFDPNVPQEVVRATIHAAPRTIVQVLLQFIAPVVLIAFVVRTAAARRRVAAGNV